MSDKIQTRPDGSRFVDMTPTWESIFPIYFEALTAATYEVQQTAKAELLRAARALDTHNKLAKVAQPSVTQGLDIPADNGREAQVETTLVWAKGQGNADAGFALDDYCNARGLNWSTDYAGTITIKGGQPCNA